MRDVRSILKSLGVRRPGHARRLERQLAELRAENKRLRRRLKPASGVVGRGRDGLTRLEVRRQHVLAGVATDPLVLEIGPAHNPTLPRRDGFRTRNADYLDRQGLIERYRHFEQYSPDDIEDVDYVLPPGAALAEVIPDRFDLVVASHVIEHTTSLVDFLNECERLLAPGGVLALVVPDHRYCFDRFRERSSLARVIDAASAPPAVHTVGAVTEERLNAARRGGVTSWGPVSKGRFEFANDLDSVRRYAEAARLAQTYIDTHNWVFTPHHLRLMLFDLRALGLIRLGEASFGNTVVNEFFVNLTVDGPGPQLPREELVRLADEERRTVPSATFQSPS